jgi:uncharacterized repeat protein (TIGR03803 family)
MKTNKFWTVLSKALAIATVTLIMALILTSGAWAANTYKILSQFNGTDGADPNDAQFVFDAAGNLYGTTVSGGANGHGTVFELSPNSDGTWTETVLYSFTGGSDGSNPMAGVIFDTIGNLYGTTLSGGNSGAGAVFTLTPNSSGGWTESVIYSFTGGSDGQQVTGGVIFDAIGNLYGTATEGGASGHGVVYELTPNSGGGWTQSVLYSFEGGKDGTYPDHASLIFDTAGNLYGEAAMGGKGNCNWIRRGCGTVFELTPNPNGTWTETVLHRFAGGKDGGTPESTLIFDQVGNLYGTTLFAGGGACGGNGGTGCGTVFQLIPKSGGGWKERVLLRFAAAAKKGTNSWGGLVFDTTGNLYGTTITGGGGKCQNWWGAGCGTVFELSPNSKGGWTEHVLHRFQGAVGGNPYGEVFLDGQGNIFGMVSGEGTSGSSGAVYEITP